MSFYVHLPSNGSQDTYPSNTYSDFKIKLPLTLNLDKYEVALTEFSYYSSIQVLSGNEKDNIITLEKLETKQELKFVIANRSYDNVHVLIDNINEIFKSQFLNLIRFHYNETKNRVRIEFDEKFKSNKLTISEKLSNILGFSGKTDFLGDNQPIANHPPNLFAGFHYIYIYTDIILPQIVGSSLVPLLRIVDTEKNGKVVLNKFESPYYLPISRSIIDTIGISLCNEYGESIKFEKGPVSLTLHFRQKI